MFLLKRDPFMEESGWLLFLAQLPTSPSSLRVNVWRRLREAGAASLQNGVWILPHNDENSLFLERLSAYVRQNDAASQIFLVQAFNSVSQAELIDRFRYERDREYTELIAGCHAYMDEIDEAVIEQKFSLVELEVKEQAFERLRKGLVKAQKRDFFPTENSHSAATAIRECRQKLYDYTHQVYTREGCVTPLNDILPFNPDEPGAHD
jgi:hypothetical protein